MWGLPRLALDATYSVDRNPTGVGVYSREILRGLAAAHAEVDWLWCYRAHSLLPSFREPLPPGCYRRLLGNGFVPRTDVFHGLNQRLPATRARRMIGTFHDLFVLTGDYSTAEFRQRFAEQAKEAAGRAERIIAVSEFTASQVCERLGVERERIRVIHHGVNPTSGGPPHARENLVLSVGAVQRRKNTRRLVEAFEGMPAGWRLVLAGSMGHGSEEIVSRIQASRRSADIELTGYLDAETLEQLYARASIFAFPSLDEGFGMPVLEAMASGVPVITSNRSALPEVAGDAALLVDPAEVEQIADGLLRLAADGDLRANLIERGLERARQFTWEDAVERTWGVYRELLD